MTPYTLILRTCGERTTAACLRMLGEPAHWIGGTPFAETLRRSFALGIAEARKYTVMVDADLLPYMHLLPTLLEAAEADDSQWFEKHALVLCKFFGRRGAGNRIYRTALLPWALALVDAYASDERPETAIIRAMDARGYGRAEIPRVVALHGYEQYNRDVYRTCYTHGVKSRARTGRWLPRWEKAARKDADYTIAIVAAKAGAQREEPLTIDAAEFTPCTVEKPALDKWAPATVKAWKKGAKG